MTAPHIAPDADDEPTLWTGDPERPTAVMRRCDNPAVFDAVERVLGLLKPLDPTARMDAYYYSFDRTGVGAIDAILSAVAIAGKGCHHTAMWTDDSIAAFYDDGLTHEQRIQHAANVAADLIRKTLEVTP